MTKREGTMRGARPKKRRADGQGLLLFGLEFELVGILWPADGAQLALDGEGIDLEGLFSAAAGEGGHRTH